jgi:sRNA-binding regulator protein Hfq
VQRFLDQDQDKFFLLSGKAGTGKTLIIENIARYCEAVVMAPTNAAVMRLRSKIGDYENIATIHKVIYGEPDIKTGEWIPKSIEFDRVYIVDESSMIDKTVLQDLLDLANIYRNRIIFCGDGFQLPPVGRDPHLFQWEESYDFFKALNHSHLNEVKRQDGEILGLANSIRDNNKINIKPSQDIKILNRFGKYLESSIKNNDNFVVIVSTNKNRLFYNTEIRKIKYGNDPAIVENNEVVISVANNYKINSEVYSLDNPVIIQEYLQQKVNIGNQVTPTIKVYDMYLVRDNGLHLLIPELDIPSLHGHQILENFKDDERFVSLSGFNKRKTWNKAVNICTYGAAITCHKAQGNEYENVFIDCQWLPDNLEINRWFYTAFTRAQKKLFIKDNKYIN